MKSKTFLTCLISIFLLTAATATTSHAVEVTCFLKDYTREKGKPVTISEDFYSAHEGTGTLKVTTNAKVTGARITLNDQVLWMQGDFKEKITYYEKEVTLHQNDNTIEVYDESKPGAWLQVEITQELAAGESYVRPLDVTKVVVDPYTGLQMVSNQILIMFKEDVSINTVTAIINGIDGLIIGYMPDLNVYQIEITTNPSVEQLKVLIEQLNNDENVETAIKNGINQLSKIPDPNKDPEWGMDPWDESNPGGRNWGLEAIFAPSAWDYTLGGFDIKVGIVDVGFNITHEDIDVEPNHAMGALNQIISYDMTWDSCGNEYKAVLFNNHGTHIVGIIGAESNDEDGITGIMWEKDLYVYRTDLQDADIYFGIIKLLRQGVKVINLSVGKFYGWANCEPCAISGSGCPSDNNPDDVNDLNNKKKFANDAMKIWMEKYGDFLIIQAAGNDGIDAKWNDFFAPVDDLEVKNRILVVASVDRPSGCLSNCSYNLSSFSNIGSQVDIAAPGESIFSTIYYSPYYDEYSGTSIAAPHVTGVAGLVWNANPNLSAAEVKQILVDTADRPFTDGGFPYRILNAYKAVKSVLEPQQPFPPISTKVISDISYAQNPDVTVDNINNIYTVYNVPYTAIMLQRSSDRGETFSPSVEVSGTPEISGEAQIAADNNNINIVWTNEALSPTYSPEIFFRRSIDQGITFTNPMNISNTPTFSLYPAISANGNGVIAIVWQDNITDFSNARTFFAISTDSGQSFQPYKQISDIPALYPRVSIDSNNNIYVVWQQKVSALYDEILFTRSTDSGQAFTSPINLSNTPVVYSQQPDIATDKNGNINIVWSEGSGNNPNIAFIRSSDLGQTFTSPQIIPQSSGWWPKIENVNSDIYITWIHGAAGVYFSKSEDGGQTFTPGESFTQIGLSSYHALAVDSDHNVHVVCSSVADGTVQVYYTRDQR